MDILQHGQRTSSWYNSTRWINLKSHIFLLRKRIQTQKGTRLCEIIIFGFVFLAEPHNRKDPRSRPGTEPMPPALEHGISTTGLPGKSFFFFFKQHCKSNVISVPRGGIEPRPQQWKPGILTIRVTRELPQCCYKNEVTEDRQIRDCQGLVGELGTKPQRSTRGLLRAMEFFHVSIVTVDCLTFCLDQSSWTCPLKRMSFRDVPGGLEKPMCRSGSNN